jgi:dihydrofolate synthase/folylpolyglutamate synthase
MQQAVDEISPSFFEITVAMAFEYFAEEKVDIAIIETGLGGRLDSTNIVVPELSVITNIGWDHANILGDTLEKIAGEKAGIIKQGIPVVVGQKGSTRNVFDMKAAAMDAPLSFADSKRLVTGWTMQGHELVAEVSKLQTDDKHYYHLDLNGIYQTKNLVTVLEAIAVLRTRGWILPDAAIDKALKQVKKLTGLHGRWELIHEHPDIIVDVAHNEDGMKEVVIQLESMTYQKLYVVIGMVKDKDIDAVLARLPKDAEYYFTRARIERALPEDQLAEAGRRHGLKGEHYPDVNTALRAALTHAGKDETLLVCGSVFVVGEVDREKFLA